VKASDKQKFVIKNAHTKAEMKAIEQEFVDHKGPFLTLQQALDQAKAQQAQQTHEKSA
jgi:hypothetical protein